MSSPRKSGTRIRRIADRATREGSPLLRLEDPPSALAGFRCVGLSGEEAVSATFEYLVEVEAPRESTPDVDRLASLLLGQPISVRLAGNGRPDAARHFHGLVTDVRGDLAATRGSTRRILLVVRPRLWLLSLFAGSRLFAERSVKEVVDALLAERGQTAEWRLTTDRRFAARPTLFQYRESDLTFLSRLLEQEGIAYWFETDADDHRLVLSDNRAAFPLCLASEPLELRDPRRDDQADERPDAVHALTVDRQMVPAAVAQSASAFEDAEARLIGDAAGNCPARVGAVNDHAGFGVDPADCRAIATILLRRIESRRCSVSGTGSVRAFAAGRVVRLPAGEAAGHLLVRVRHDAFAAGRGGYQNRFDAVPFDLPMAPACRHLRPQIAGPLLARVVTAPDAHGRCRVRFDCDPRRTASAPLPLAHPFDAVLLPRVGQRVAVSFLEGDPDQPLIDARIDNADSFPFAPDDHQERGGIFTGRHRLQFDDGCSPHVELYADGDLRQVVAGATESLADEEFSVVRGDRRHTTRGDHLQAIDGNLGMETGGSTSLVAGAQIAVQAGEKLYLKARELVIDAAGSFLSMGPSGIVLKGKVTQINPPGVSSPGGSVPSIAPCARPAAAHRTRKGKPQRATS